MYVQYVLYVLEISACKRYYENRFVIRQSTSRRVETPRKGNAKYLRIAVSLRLENPSRKWKSAKSACAPGAFPRRFHFLSPARARGFRIIP